MTLAHISDTHLGKVQFPRNNPSGINQRTIDVLVNFRANLDSISGRKPDLVLHTGDLFDKVKPDNHTIVQVARSVRAFQAERDNAPFVLCGGNHDSPQKVIDGNIQQLIGDIPGVYFAGNMSTRFDITELDCEVLCVPSNSLRTGENVAYIPSLGRAHSVLCVHGMASQALPKEVDIKHAAYDVNDLHTSLFSYVGLGDFHGHQVYAPNCCFAGSTDFTSSNFWDEVKLPKGWVWFDTEIGKLEHVAVPTREVIDLPSIDADALSPDELRAAIQAQAVWEGQPIVRQKVINLHPSDKRALFSTSFVREIGARALNYQLVTTPPAFDRGTGQISTVAPEAKTLEVQWSAHASECPIPKTVEREALIASGLELLKEAACA